VHFAPVVFSPYHTRIQVTPDVSAQGKLAISIERNGMFASKVSRR